MKVFTNIVIVPSIRDNGESFLDTLKGYRFEAIMTQGQRYFSARLPRGWYTVEKNDGICYYDEASYLMFIAYKSESGIPFIHVLREPHPVQLDAVWA